MMNPEIKAKWIEALRSGRYQQAKGTLRQDARTQEIFPNNPMGGMCCLGVLCDVQGINWEELPEGMNLFQVGLTPEFAGGLSFYWRGVLTNLNDGGATFAEIADYIERNIP